MNGYERVKCALSGQRPDCRPVMLHDFQTCVKEYGIGFNQFREDPQAAAECFIRNAEKYDLDVVLIDVDTATLAGACGCRIAFPDDKAAVAVKGVIDDISEAGDLKPIRVEDYRFAVNWLEISRKVCEYFGDEKYVRCNCDQAAFSLASMLRGSQELMVDLMDEDAKEDIHRLLEYCEGVSEQFIRLAAQTGAHCVSNGDSVAGPAMISPAMYEEFALPYEKRLSAAAHACGKDHFIHICGDTSAILKYFPSIGVDAMELDYKTDLRKMHDVMASGTAVSGTLDPAGVFFTGTEELVTEKVQELGEIYADSQRLIFCSGCALSPDTPEENIRAFVQAVRALPA